MPSIKEVKYQIDKLPTNDISAIFKQFTLNFYSLLTAINGLESNKKGLDSAKEHLENVKQGILDNSSSENDLIEAKRDFEIAKSLYQKQQGVVIATAIELSKHLTLQN